MSLQPVNANQLYPNQQVSPNPYVQPQLAAPQALQQGNAGLPSIFELLKENVGLKQENEQLKLALADGDNNGKLSKEEAEKLSAKLKEQQEKQPALPQYA